MSEPKPPSPSHAARYRQDPRYREAVLRSAHRRYRASKATAPTADWREVEAKAQAPRLGYWRPAVPVAMPDLGPITIATMTTAELAAAMGRSEGALKSWRSAGRFPKTSHRSRLPSGRLVGLYTVAVARRILAAYAAHLRDRSDHFRGSHAELAAAFLAAAGQEGGR